ncbi:MAG: lipoprotein signal peptidase [Burkholderiales bacterium]|nr:lipoprotein signal peptidase [Burkholderiales bacterium]
MSAPASQPSRLQDEPRGGAGGRASWLRVAAWLAIALAVAVLDQLTKAAIRSSIAPGEVVPVTGFFNLVLVFNTGAAFSVLAGASGWQREFFIGIGAVAAAVILYLLRRHGRDTLFCAGLAAILGGALGNLYDRVLLGKVVDFLDFHARGWHWPAFNAADSAITVGAALVIADTLLAGRRKTRASG